VRFICALLLLISIATPCGAGQLPRGFTEQYMSTLKQVLQADHEMYAQMQVAANRLEQFYFRNGHFPETTEERAAFRELLGKNIIGNPYKPEITDQIEHRRLTAPYTVAIYWMQDSALKRGDFRRLLQQPDPSWLGEPGTLFILTNTRSTYLVFGTSADRLPVRDLAGEGSPPRMICKEIQRNVN
jgi:hypothetical protein